MPTQVILRNGQPTSIQPSVRRLSLSNRSRRRRGDLTNLSSQDISASSRLAGYLFIFTAYVVLLVSNITYEIIVIENDNDSSNSIIERPHLSRWKQQSSLYGSAVMIFLNVVIVGVHFDTRMSPKLWRGIFRDGSNGEGNILISFIFAALFMVYVSTSSNAIGGFVGLNINVYFSSWFGFFATVYTYTVWCNGAGKLSIIEKLKDSPRKTTYYWTLTLIFSTVTFLSLLDIFLEKGGMAELMKKNHLIMIISSSSSVVCCVFALMMNICCPNHDRSIPLFLTEGCILDWRLLEGLTLLLMGGFWTWVVYNLTGINGLVNGPSNAYFAAWGSFFCSISCCACWMKEHQLRLSWFRSND